MIFPFLKYPAERPSGDFNSPDLFLESGNWPLYFSAAPPEATTRSPGPGIEEDLDISTLSDNPSER
jgi:hypothetical protein